MTTRDVLLDWVNEAIGWIVLGLIGMAVVAAILASRARRSGSLDDLPAEVIKKAVEKK